MWKELLDLLRSENLLSRAWGASLDMLKAAQEMTLEAIHVLRESDEATVREEIRAKDKMVNQYERDVRRMVMTHCTVRGASALPSGMALISIVIDIERIGDYAKNIMDLAVVHPQRLVVPEFEDRLRTVEGAVKTRFQDTIEIVKTQDVEKARASLATYKEEISRVCDAMVNQVVAGEVPSLSPPDAAAVVLYARYLKRIGAHLKNVTTSVVNPFEWIGFREVKEENRT